MKTFSVIKSLLLLTLFASLSFSSFADAPNKKFTIGMIFPLSGGLADYGAAIQHGFEMAAEEAPEAFSHIELRYEDSKYDEKIALNAFNALEQKGGVSLYHTWGVSPNASILPVANSKHRPVIAETSMITAAKDRPYVIRASRTGYAAAEKLVEAFVKKGWKHVGVIVTQIPYYNDIAEALVSFGTSNGISVEIVDEVTPSEQEFRSVLLKLKNKKFDALGPLLLADQVVTFCSQARAVNFSYAMFGAHIHNSLELLSKCQPYSEGTLFPGMIVAKEFRDRYVAKYGTDMRLDSAADSYETAKIIGELFGNERSFALSADEIIEKFKSVSKDGSSVGELRYSETAQAGKAITFHEIALTYENGEIVPFK